MVADAYHAGRFDVTGALICLAAVAFIMSATRRVLARQPADTLPGLGDLGLLCGVLALLLCVPRISSVAVTCSVALLPVRP